MEWIYDVSQTVADSPLPAMTVTLRLGLWHNPWDVPVMVFAPPPESPSSAQRWVFVSTSSSFLVQSPRSPWENRHRAVFSVAHRRWGTAPRGSFYWRKLLKWWSHWKTCAVVLTDLSHLHQHNYIMSYKWICTYITYILHFHVCC